MARKSNTKVDYSQLSSAMQDNAKQIYDDKRQEEQPEAPVVEEKKPEPVVVNTAEPKTSARKKGTNSKIRRENGVCLYLEDRHKEIVENIIFNNRIKNQQRIIQTALNEFIRKYYAEGKLNDKGVELIKAYDESVKG